MARAWRSASSTPLSACSTSWLSSFFSWFGRSEEVRMLRMGCFTFSKEVAAKVVVKVPVEVLVAVDVAVEVAVQVAEEVCSRA